MTKASSKGGNLRDKLDGNELDLSLSDLNEVPVKELAALPKATILDLSCNKLTSLPADFCSLTHLVKLDLSKNKLQQLPADFGRLVNLQHLDLLNNRLVTLPVSFAQLKSLKWLDLKDNPLDPALAKVAGDCLDEKQCKQCANKPADGTAVSTLREPSVVIERGVTAHEGRAGRSGAREAAAAGSRTRGREEAGGQAASQGGSGARAAEAGEGGREGAPEKGVRRPQSSQAGAGEEAQEGDESGPEIQVRLSPPQAAAPETQPVVGRAEAAAAAAAVCGRRAGGLSGDGAAAAAPVHQREHHLRQRGPGAARPRHPAVGAADRLPAVSSPSTPAASQPWSSDSYGIGFCRTQPLSSVRPTCHPHVAADWYLRSPLCRTCSLVRVPWWNKEKWEVGTVTCMPEGTGLGGQREKQPFLVVLQSCVKARLVSTKRSGQLSLHLYFCTSQTLPFLPPHVARADQEAV